MNLVATAVSTAFGLVMVAAGGLTGDGYALHMTVAAAAMVLLANVFRPAATLAVVLVVAAIVIGQVPPILCALSGVCAAGYLVLRHTATLTMPTAVGALGFAVAGLAATSIPVRIAWLPLVAPPAILVLFVLVTQPFWSDVHFGRADTAAEKTAGADNRADVDPGPPGAPSP